MEGMLSSWLPVWETEAPSCWVTQGASAEHALQGCRCRHLSALGWGCSRDRLIPRTSSLLWEAEQAPVVSRFLRQGDTWVTTEVAGVHRSGKLEGVQAGHFHLLLQKLLGHGQPPSFPKTSGGGKWIFTISSAGLQ
jgi:hypothetical protein